MWSIMKIWLDNDVTDRLVPLYNEKETKLLCLIRQGTVYVED